MSEEKRKRGRSGTREQRGAAGKSIHDEVGWDLPPHFFKKRYGKLIKYYVRTQTMSLIVAPVCGSDDSLSERVAPRSSLPSIGILLYLPSEAAGENGIMFNVFAKSFERMK